METNGRTVREVMQYILIELVCEHDLSVAEAVTHIAIQTVQSAKEVYPENFIEPYPEIFMKDK